MTHGDQSTILHKSEERGVINKELLIALVTEQGPKREAGRLFLEDGIQLENVTDIRIEFLNILNIDHLWVMPNLVKLKLSNNRIEKIENLDMLVNLKELDLSFNNICIMENLNNLKKLEVLQLFENEISVVEGIDDLQGLTIFSIGNNKIADWDHVMYLRKFKKLRSLNISGNSCMEQEGYLDYLFAFMPQLVYFQYKMIKEEQRQAAVQIHFRAIHKLEEKEAKEKEEVDKQKAFEEHIALLSISYVEYLDGDYLFEKMFEHDKDGKDLQGLNDDTQNAFEEYRKIFSAISQELYELGLKEQIKRSDEITLFKDIVNEGKDANQKDARQIVDDVLEKKAEIISGIKELIESMTEELDPDILYEKVESAQHHSEQFNDLLSKTWAKLMHQEVVLHEQMEDINEVFKINMTDMVGQFLETAQGYFSQMRSIESEFNNTMGVLATLVMNSYGGPDDAKMPPHLLDICGDKDTLSNNLAATHDIHLQVIDDREDRMVSRLKTWVEEYTEKNVSEERDRHRRQVLEISHFLDYQRTEFNALQLQNAGNTDPDVAAVLEE
ncbi:dynein regulatory complex subunit 3 [Orussus abietinus]|uniref:dynein regulatory complex subunit 3 n=1 Tax=Orussus abietinus TaxID=222816 RepID=UPI000625B970|nr:dynein regulatory complex subunit 3 [Orussus abietinus]